MSGFGKSAGPTDVLSFSAVKRLKPAMADKQKIPGHTRLRLRVPLGVVSGDALGDIAIAPAVAKRNAKSYGRTFAAELKILILHGDFASAGLRPRSGPRRNGPHGIPIEKAVAAGVTFSWLFTLGILILAFGLPIFSYLTLIYRELGRMTTGRIHEHLEIFEAEIEPKLHIRRRSGTTSSRAILFDEAAPLPPWRRRSSSSSIPRPDGSSTIRPKFCRAR